MRERVPFVCGNWKMYKTTEEARALIAKVAAGLQGLDGVEVGVAPPFTALSAARPAVEGTPIRLVAQNVHPQAEGAFTGEVSAAMLKDVGCEYVIIGHSERRTLFHESDAGCADKVASVLAAGMGAILCVGETLAQRDGGETLSVVTTQLAGGLAKLEAEHFGRVVVAYEPVWAIGTGRTATPAQAQEVHAHIRAEIRRKHGSAVASALRIQYGGSVKPENAQELFGQPDIDGGLIGGAALKAEAFLAICQAAA